MTTATTDSLRDALLATALISLAPLVVLAIFPLLNACCGGRGKKQVISGAVLHVLVSFAVGGLLGDAFLHLIPHALEAGHGHSHHDHSSSPTSHAHDHDHSHDHVHDAHSSEEWLPSMSDDKPAKPAKPAHDHSHSHSHSHDHDHSGHSHSHDHDHDHSGHSHSHSHGDSDGESGHKHDHSNEERVGLLVLGGMLVFFLLEKCALKYAGSGEGGHGHSHGHGHGQGQGQGKQEKNKKKKKEKLSDDEGEEELTDAKAKAASKVGGILNVIADMSHNFTDGMAIAASFRYGNVLGWGTTTAVLIHEVPHEIGDFAILIQCGWSVKSAIFTQILTAFGAFLGVIVGHYSGDSEIGSAWILPVTAGGFIYVALVGVIPSLLAANSSLFESFAQVCAMVTGVGLMVMISAFE